MYNKNKYHYTITKIKKKKKKKITNEYNYKYDIAQYYTILHIGYMYIYILRTYIKHNETQLYLIRLDGNINP